MNHNTVEFFHITLNQALRTLNEAMSGNSMSLKSKATV